MPRFLARWLILALSIPLHAHRTNPTVALGVYILGYARWQTGHGWKWGTMEMKTLPFFFFSLDFLLSLPLRASCQDRDRAMKDVTFCCPAYEAPFVRVPTLIHVELSGSRHERTKVGTRCLRFVRWRGWGN
jgi:hypothetical protein